MSDTGNSVKQFVAHAPPTVILDLDDAFDGNDRLPLLEELRRQIPQLCVTLFAIPGRCSPEWVQAMQQRADWIDIVPHGWMHETNRECQRWTRDQCETALHDAESLGFTTRGFKAPGWQISDGCYVELLSRGYWVADQPYNNARRPAGLRCYLLGEVGGAGGADASQPAAASAASIVQIHGHIGHLNGHNANELEYLVPEILKHRDSEFGFVRDVVR